MAEGLTGKVDFDDAVAAALAEVGETDPIEEDPALSAGESEAAAEADDAEFEDLDSPDPEQPEAPEEFDFESPGATDDEDSTPVALAQDDALVQIPGRAEPLTVAELRNGYLRHDDYTRKTQELAEQRRQLEESMTAEDRGNAELWQAMQEDPIGTIRYLARHLGADDVEKSLVKLNDVQYVPATQVDEIVKQRMQQALAQHPEVQQARAARIQHAIDSGFAAVERKVGKPLSDNAKAKILNFAADNGISSIEVAFDALSARMGTRAPERQRLDKAKPQKRDRAAREGAPTRPRDEVLDFDDSVRAAMAQLEAMSEV